MIPEAPTPDQAQAVGRFLLELAEPSSHSALASPDRDDLAVANARKVYRLRRRRENVFSSSPELFCDPAWDLLLDLFIREGERRTTSITAACIGANVPVTTGLRWINRLIDLGYAVRNADAKDGRRGFLSLTADAREKIISLMTC